ncbi:YdbL family protein [Sphingopyxis panaciterrae]|uniref:YdbL family protein n=1 Tax=Sphingopyxis panaciterrae TaxID=363841 RepID=UPI001421A185|nr:YdbL family protein [Sphingopyxis panaciterrae]
MKSIKHGKPTALALVAVAVTAAIATPSAMAQRNPAYEAARAAGQVGEQPDGYLGYASSPTPAVRAIVDDINIKRKAAYTSGAPQGSTVEQFAFVTGCNLIAKTKPGEKYKAPDGSWKTRDGGAPVRDSRCP